MSAVTHTPGSAPNLCAREPEAPCLQNTAADGRRVRLSELGLSRRIKPELPQPELHVLTKKYTYSNKGCTSDFF